jgi:hypothetical protein
MTVTATNVSTGPYTANGSTTAFPFTFAAASSTEVTVTSNGATVPPSLYTVVVTAGGGGTVTFTTAPVNGTSILISSLPNFGQPTTFENNGAFLPATFNSIHDRFAVTDLYLNGRIDTTAASTLAAVPAIVASQVSVTPLVVTSSTGQSVTTRGLLAGVTGAVAGTTRVKLTEAGRDGEFEAITTDAAAVASDPGQGIYVAGIGVTWRRVYTGALNVKWFGATGDGTTDDTTAIQRAINYACLLGVAKIFFPSGIYLVTNLSIPAYTALTNGNRVIEFVGVAQPSTVFGTVFMALTQSVNGSIIKSASTSGAIVAVAGSGFSQYHVVFRDLVLRAYDNPNITGIDAGWAAQLSGYNLQIDTGIYNMNGSQPTHTNAYGIITPKIGNGALTRLQNVAVSGFYVGLDVNEHTNGDDLYFHSCAHAMFFEAMNDSARFGRVLAQCCTQVVGVIGACRFDINQLMIEHLSTVIAAAHPGTAWMATTEDFRDTGDAAHANVRVELVKGDVGPVALSNLLWTNGKNIFVTRVGDSLTPSGFYGIGGTVATVGDGTELTLTFSGTSVPMDGLAIDTDQTKIKCQIAGVYDLEFRVVYPANATGARQLKLGLNGTSTIDEDRKNAAVTGETSLRVTRRAYLAVNDYVQLSTHQTSGSALSVSVNSYSGSLTAQRIAANWG